MVVFHLSNRRRQQLSVRMFNKLKDDKNSLIRYFDGVDQKVGKNLDFNLLFSDMEPPLNLKHVNAVQTPSPTAARSSRPPPPQNINLEHGLQNFLYGKPQNATPS